MADAQATFSVDLEDNTSGAAESAASALERLEGSIKADTAALAAMQRAMNNLQKGSSVNIDQYRELKAKIDEKRESIARAQSAYLSLGGEFRKTGGGARSFKERIAELTKQAQGVGGPLGDVAGRLGNLRSMLAGGAIALGVVAISAAMVALTVAAVGATAALLKYGIAQANARRSELLRIEGLTKMRNWWGVAAGNANEMQASLDRVSASTALGRDKLAQYQAELYRMNLRGKNLELALEAAAIKGAVLGDEGAKSAMQWAAGMNMAGQSVQRLTDDIKARFGRVAAAQLLDLDVQSAKLRENFGALFHDLRIEGLLKAVSSITGLFSQSTRSGQALKALMTTLLNPLISAIDYAAPYVKRFFQGIIIGALLVGIGILKVRRWFRETFGGSEVLGSLDLTKAALYAGIAAVGVLGLAFVATFGLITAALVAAAPFIWAAITAVAGLAVAGLAMAAPFILGAAAIGLWVYAWYQLIGAIREIDWPMLGKYMIGGLVDGLKGGVSWVIDTVKSIGTSAISAFKETLGIASPSKEFANLGKQIPAGLEQGISAGAADAQGAVEGLVDTPGAARAGSSGPITIEVGGITIQVQNGTAAEVAEGLEEKLAGVFERIALQLGAPLPGAS